MKKLLFALLVVALLAATVTPAVAAVETKKSPTYFNVRGTIKSVDATAGTITVSVVLASSLAHQYRHKDLVVQTTSTTTFRNRQSDGSFKPMKMTKLTAGKTVRVVGNLTAGVYVATVVRQSVILP